MIAPLSGFLLLDKPVGLSSNAALQRVRHMAQRVKGGHGGSLDPLASGMLPICLGEATRFAGELLGGRKAYRFVLKLGERSATGDAEGEIIERAPVPQLARGQIEAVLAGFLGAQMQVPPMYAALKRDGEPLYRLARRGLTVERAPRALQIDELQLLDLQPEHLEMRVLCSKGTYVRVLGEDIARALGSCGRLDALRRLYVEPFAPEPMVALDELEGLDCSAWPLLPPDRALLHLPPLQLAPSAARALAQGRVLPWAEAVLSAVALASAASSSPGERWRLYDQSGCFLGLGATGEGGRLMARRLLRASALL